MYTMSDIKKGLKIQIDNVPFIVEYFQHVKPGKGAAFVRTKIRNLLTGNLNEKTFKAGDKFEPAQLEERKMQYLYKENKDYCFMDNETYEQITLTEEQVGEASQFMSENLEAAILYFQGKHLSLTLPLFVELKVVKADPWIKGDTASSTTKPVILTTGASIQVPPFVIEGDMIKIDTRTGEYVTRV